MLLVTNALDGAVRFTQGALTLNNRRQNFIMQQLAALLLLFSTGYC